MANRNYSNTAPPVALTSTVTAGAVSLPVASTAGYPAAPFLLGLERGTANEEVCLCTAVAAGAFTVTRGYDGTTAKGHNSGTSIEHTVAAIDYTEAAQAATNLAALLATPTAKGDLLVHNGTALTREPVGTDGMVLVADSTDPNGIRWGVSGADAADLVNLFWMESH